VAIGWSLYSKVPGIISLRKVIDGSYSNGWRFTFEACLRGESMAKYGKAAGKSVKSAMHREKRGTLRSGKNGKGGVVTSRKQAIAIGLSEARKKGAKVPKKKSS
jgi:hypothetical protein